MAELKNRQWLVAARPEGLIKEGDFRWNETGVPPLDDGQVLVRNLAFSFDPTERGWMSMDTILASYHGLQFQEPFAFCRDKSLDLSKQFDTI